jgi:hypothetical protein
VALIVTLVPDILPGASQAEGCPQSLSMRLPLADILQYPAQALSIFLVERVQSIQVLHEISGQFGGLKLIHYFCNFLFDSHNFGSFPPAWNAPEILIRGMEQVHAPQNGRNIQGKKRPPFSSGAAKTQKDTPSVESVFLDFRFDYFFIGLDKP